MSADSARRVVLNQRLVKDRDGARARELHRVVWIAVALLVPVLFYVWQEIEYLRTGYQMEELRVEKNKLTEWNRQLRLERATLLELKRIEALGRSRLGLVPPAAENTVKIRLTGDSGPVARRSGPVDGLAAAER